MLEGGRSRLEIDAARAAVGTITVTENVVYLMLDVISGRSSVANWMEAGHSQDEKERLPP